MSSLGNALKVKSKRKGGRSKKNNTIAQESFVAVVQKNAEAFALNSKSCPFIFRPDDILYNVSDKKLDVNKWYQYEVGNDHYKNIQTYSCHLYRRCIQHKIYLVFCYIEECYKFFV